MRTTRRAFALGVATALMAALIIAAAFLYSRARQGGLIESRAVARLARDVLALTLARELAIDGYLLTGRTELLSADGENRAAAESKADSLLTLTSPDAQLHALVLVARGSIGRWETRYAIDALDGSAIRNGRAGAVAAAGRPMVDEFRRALGELTSRAEQNYQSQVRAVAMAQRIVAAAIVVALILLLGVVTRLRRVLLVQFGVTAAHRQDLARANDELRQRAQEMEDANTELEVLTDTLQGQAVELEEHAADLQAANVQLEQSYAEVSQTNREQTALLAALSEVVLVLDRDGQYLKVGRAYDHPSLPSAEERLGRHVHDILPADAANAVVALVREALDGASVRRGEIAIRFDEVATTWFETTAVPIDRGRVVFVGRDISARKRDESSLRERDERYRLLSQATNEVMFDADFVSGRVEWNDALLSTMRYRPEQMDDRMDTWRACVHPDDAPRVLSTARDAVAGTATVWTQEYRFRRGDDSYATVLSRGYIQRDAEGRAQRMIGSMLDLTERYALEGQLRQSQKMDAVGQLAGGVAHDFNNLLTVITSYAGMALETTSLAADDREALVEIDSAARRAADLTRQLLTFSRQRVYEPRVIDLNATVREAETLLRRLLPTNIDFIARLGDDAGAVRADPQQIGQILMNLAVNARDAMPEGGQFTIDTARAFLTESLLLGHAVVPPGSYVVITVADTGVGMTAEVQERLFEPFFTTKPVGEGTGLGLATVYGIVHQFG